MLTANGRWAAGLSISLAAGGWVFGYAFLYALSFVFLGALVVAYLWLLRQPELASFQQLKPPVVGAGEPANVVLTISNTGQRVSRARLGRYDVGDVARSVTIERLAPGEETFSTVLLPTHKRGHYPVGPLVITSTDPFGLMERPIYKGGKTSLIVHPQIHTLSSLPTGHRRELEGSRSAIPQEGGISFHSLRDYVTGDDRRLIHWRSVAKTNTLMVRKNVITSEPRYLVVLDTAASSYERGAFEDAVRMAASMINAGYESRYPVTFRTTGGLETEISTAGDGRTATMRLLAGVQVQESDPGLNAIVRFGADASGVSLGAVTGYPQTDQLAGLRRVQHLFDMTTLVQLGNAGTESVELPGVIQIEGENSGLASDRWMAVFGS